LSNYRLPTNAERSCIDIFWELQRRSPYTLIPRDVEHSSPSATETREEQWQEDVIPRTFLLANFREMLCQLTLVAIK
jgi:hypothetical protein